MFLTYRNSLVNLTHCDHLADFLFPLQCCSRTQFLILSYHASLLWKVLKPSWKDMLLRKWEAPNQTSSYLIISFYGFSYGFSMFSPCFPTFFIFSIAQVPFVSRGAVGAAEATALRGGAAPDLYLKEMEVHHTHSFICKVVWYPSCRVNTSSWRYANTFGSRMPVLQAAAALLLVFFVFGVNIHSSIFTSFFLIYKDNRIYGVYKVSVFFQK